MKRIIPILLFSAAAFADISGEYNTWLGYLAGKDASGDRTTVHGAGAGGEASELHRTDLIGAAAGVHGYRFYDTVGIGYRALRYASDVSNTVAIGSHAFEGVNMGGIKDATWINGHFVANPPKHNGSYWEQLPGEFYVTGDATQTNNLAPIWYDGTNLHLRGFTGGGVTNAITYQDMMGITSCAVEQTPWFRNEVTYFPQKTKVAFYSSSDPGEGAYTGDASKVPMVYLRKNENTSAIEVWEGDTCLGTLTVTPQE